MHSKDCYCRLTSSFSMIKFLKPIEYCRQKITSINKVIFLATWPCLFFIFTRRGCTVSRRYMSLQYIQVNNHTLISSDPDIRSDPLEFQAIVFTQPWWSWKTTNSSLRQMSLYSNMVIWGKCIKQKTNNCIHHIKNLILIEENYVNIIIIIII